MPSLDQLVAFVTNTNFIPASLLIVILAGFRRIWVFGWVLDDKQKQCDQLRIERDMYRERADQARDELIRTIQLDNRALTTIEKARR